jgi:hypothetical protein
MSGSGSGSGSGSSESVIGFVGGCICPKIYIVSSSLLQLLQVFRYSDTQMFRYSDIQTPARGYHFHHPHHHPSQRLAGDKHQRPAATNLLEEENSALRHTFIQIPAAKYLLEDFAGWSAPKGRNPRQNPHQLQPVQRAVLSDTDAQ